VAPDNRLVEAKHGFLGETIKVQEGELAGNMR
jgi:hypothetical protein